MKTNSYRKKIYKKASFTIETALLMPIILMIVLLLFFLLLYMYNLGVMQEAACRGAKQYFYHNGETNRTIEQECASLVLSDLKENLVGVEDADVRVSVSARQVNVEITGKLNAPEFIGSKALKLDNLWSYDVVWEEERLCPSEYIRTKQQIKNIYDYVTEESEAEAVEGEADE